MSLNAFAGKRILVTGGSKRIGAYIVRAFAAAGAKVIIHYHNSESEAKALLEELGGEEAGHTLTAFDLSRPEKIAEFADTLPTDIDILVSNAAVFDRVPFAEETLAAGKREFDINFWSPVELIRQISKRTRSPEFCAICITDCAIAETARDSFSYLLSKKVLSEAVRLAAIQLAPRVRINAVAPGPMLPPPGKEHLKMQKTLSGMPLNRPVSPEELAESVLFLAGSKSSTGTILFIDCGKTL